MRPISARSVLLGCVIALSGCGGRSTDQSRLGNGAGASNAGSAGAGGGHTGEAGAGGSGAGGSGVAGTGAGGMPAECASYVEAKPRSVSVLIRNDLTFAIHLGPRMQTCSETPLFLVQDAAGKEVSGPGPCRTPCETLLVGNPVGGCTAICPAVSAITLAPGQSVATDWAGLFDIESDLPKECVPQRSDGLDFGTQCEHSQTVPPGTYAFSAQAGTALDCSETTTDGCQACTRNADGSCSTPNALVAGAAYNARSVVEITADGRNASVTLAFED